MATGRSAGTFARGILIALVVLASPLWLAAQNSQEVINIQGDLKFRFGNTPVSGATAMSFALYNSAGGGGALFAEVQTINVDDGHYFASIGSLTAGGIPETVFTNASLYLGITVGTDAEMTPRIQLASSAFALNAMQVNNATGTQNIGTGAGTDTINIGNGGGSDVITIGAIGSTTTVDGTFITTGTVTFNTLTTTDGTAIATGTTSDVVTIVTGTGADTVEIGNTDASDAIAIASTLGGAGTIRIAGTGATTAQTIDVGTGAAAHAVTIGSTNTTASLVLQSGTGDIVMTTTDDFSLNGVAASDYAIGAATTTGTIAIGGTAQTGLMTLGSSTAANTLGIAAGTGATTLNIANAQTGGSVNIGAAMTTGTISIGGAAQTGTMTLGSSTAANTLTIAGGTGATTLNIANAQTAGSVNVGAAMTTGTITIGGTGAQTGTIGIGTGTGAQTISLGTGTGLKTLGIGGTGANVITIGNTQTAGSVSVGAAMTTGTVSLGGAAQTGTMTLGQSTASNTINIGGAATAAAATQTINIGTTGIADDTADKVINIGTSLGDNDITIGAVSNSSSLLLNAGTGGIALTGVTGITGATTVTGILTQAGGGATALSGTLTTAAAITATAGGLNMGGSAVAADGTITRIGAAATQGNIIVDAVDAAGASTVTVTNSNGGQVANLAVEGSVTVGTTTTLNTIAYTWPAAGSQLAGEVLTTNGAGVLDWGSAAIPAGSLDFTEFKDAMTLDAATDIAMAGLTLSTSGAGTVTFGNTTAFNTAAPTSLATGTGLTTTGGALTTAGALTVSAGGAAITGAITGSTTITAGTGLTVTAGGATVTGNSTLTGTLTAQTAVATEDQLILAAAVGGAGRFSGTITNADLTAARVYTLPDAAGNILIAGNPDAGAFTTLTSTGATTIGNGAVLTAIGNVGGTASVTSTTWNVTAAGAASFASVTNGGALATNGNVGIGDAGTDQLTVTSEILGSLNFEGATDDNVYTTFGFTDPTGARTITFPDDSGTVALLSGAATQTFTSSVALNGTSLAIGDAISDLMFVTSSISGAATPGGDPAMLAAQLTVGTQGFIFEGNDGADADEGLLTTPSLTADRQWDLPDASGTIVVTGTAPAFTALTVGMAGAGVDADGGGLLNLGTTNATSVAIGSGLAATSITGTANAITLTADTGALTLVGTTGTTVNTNVTFNALGTSMDFAGAGAVDAGLGALTLGGTNATSVAIGNGANATALTGTANAITLTADTGNISLNGVAGSLLNIGSDGAVNSVILGDSGGTDTIAINGVVAGTADAGGTTTAPASHSAATYAGYLTVTVNGTVYKIPLLNN